MNSKIYKNNMYKHNQRILGIAVIMVLLIFANSCTAGSGGKTESAITDNKKSTLQTILERGTIRVGTTGDFNPMSFKDPATGEYAGHDIEMIIQLAADMGVEVDWVATDWKNLVSGVAAGKYDITTGASYSMGRAKTAGYTLPVVNVGTVPLTLKKNDGRFNTWKDLNNTDVSVAVTLGTIFQEQALSLFPDAQIVSVESPARDFQEVLAGRTDVSITSTFEASELIKTYPELMIIPVEEPKFSNGIGLLAPQNDQVFINYLNIWIIMKTKSGYLQELEDKWLALK
ncbi:MAG: transporter substrate-binding domain-containing protein [Spirochaetia bacterium]|jgi:cyclohexadienyl dehydratase|nr:transporter substrate-binding domain-containing protein [Spirochaetia bacterium]